MDRDSNHITMVHRGTRTLTVLDHSNDYGYLRAKFYQLQQQNTDNGVFYHLHTNDLSLTLEKIAAKRLHYNILG